MLIINSKNYERFILNADKRAARFCNGIHNSRLEKPNKWASLNKWHIVKTRTIIELVMCTENTNGQELRARACVCASRAQQPTYRKIEMQLIFGVACFRSWYMANGRNNALHKCIGACVCVRALLCYCCFASFNLNVKKWSELW